MQKRCPICNEILEKNDTVCKDCNEFISESSIYKEKFICEVCGAENEKGTNHCAFCCSIFTEK